MSLRSKLIRLAHQEPGLRSHILPILKDAGNPYAPARNPFVGVDPETAEGTFVKILWKNIETAEREVHQAKAALTKYERNPAHYKPQLDNLKDSLKTVMYMGKFGYEEVQELEAWAKKEYGP